MNEPYLPIEIAPNVWIEFVLVKPGSFVMGDAKDGDNDEKPEHRVYISQPFYMGRYPVTQAQWAAVMGNNPADFPGDDQRPVESISWNEITGTDSEEPGFLAHLPRVDGYTFRLPTEAEWEYAAKGGHLAPVVARQVTAAELYPSYAGGEDINAVAWQNENNAYTTLRCGHRQPNALGLYDMSGNVYEWCQDTWDTWDDEAYAQRSHEHPEVDPLVDESGEYRVLRGGPWAYFPRYCRSALASVGFPMIGSGLYGFRLVLSPSSGH